MRGRRGVRLMLMTALKDSDEENDMLGGSDEKHVAGWFADQTKVTVKLGAGRIYAARARVAA